MMEEYRKDPLHILAPEGLFLVGIAAGGVLVGLWLGLKILTGIFVFLTLGMIYFFRDPRRKLRINERLILCPADGRVLEVERVREEQASSSDLNKVSIFMSPFDVHVNRAPTDGRVAGRNLSGRKHLRADAPESSANNVQVALFLRDPRGRMLLLKQIVGAIARRVVCHPREGDEIKQGERIGIIRFGSRVELFFPDPVRILVAPGDRVRGGETVIGEWQ